MGFFVLNPRYGRGWHGTGPAVTKVESSGEFTILDSDGNSFTAPLTVKDADGNSFSVPCTVLDSAGDEWDLCAGDDYGTDFVMLVETTAAAESFTIPCQNVGTFDATVDWGDGTTSAITAYNDADLAHTYANPGYHRIRISGTFPNIYFFSGGDKLKVRQVPQLGSVGWTRLDRAFQGCSGMTAFNAGTCDTSSVTAMNVMFFGCSSLETCDVSTFDTSNVTLMDYMFNGCAALTSLDLSSFDTSSVTKMEYMFYQCTNAQSIDVTSFDVSKVTTFLHMFQSCTSLTDLDVSGFVTTAASTTERMFQGCSSLTTLDVSNFDMNGVLNASVMFFGCSSLTSLDVSGWDMSTTTRVDFMFTNCTALSGLTLNGWDVSAVTNGASFMSGANSAITDAEYDACLLAWDALPSVSTCTWHFGDAKYTESAARASLVGKGWTITDGGAA